MRKVSGIIILIILISTSLRAQWIIQSPLPTDSYLNTVQFLNKNTGYAGGTGGKIIKTTNGGINWFYLNTNINPNGGMLSVIFSLSFINTDIGYAVTPNKIIKTTNAGNNWTTLDSGHFMNLKFVQFTDLNVGYAGGGHNVIKSTNSGNNWFLQDSSQYYYIFSGYFLNASTGFFSGNELLGGMILKTTNGGLKWELFYTGTQIANAIFFVNESVGYVAGSAGNNARTTNGGINWIQNYSIGSQINYLKFNNDSAGIAVGDNMIATTTNSGLNWIKHYPGYGYKLSYGSFSDLSNGYFVGLNGLIIKTTNFGLNFSVTSSGTIKNLYSIHFINSKTGFSAGDYGAILKTTNSGLNWFSLNLISAANVFQSIYFTDSLNGLVCDWDGYIWKTTNGGTNWQSQFLGMGLFDIDFVNNNTGYICGSGCILKTTNKGINWIGQDPGIAVEFRSIFFLDENTGYSGGKYGNLIKTTNGGVNWISLNSGSTQIIFSIYFVNQITGYLLTCNSILKTTNAGNSWFENLTGIVDCLEGGIEFSDENTGYAVGGQQANYSLVYKTTNGGINWNQQTCDVKRQLYSLSIINSDTVFAAGWNGSILRTINGGGNVWININNSEIPSSFSLGQNYPNPFNPVTNIQFQVPPCHSCGGRGYPPGHPLVVIKVYDLLGKEVKTLVNEYKQPGTYQVSFNAEGLSTGIYFYRMTAGDFSETKKLVLIK